MQSSAAETACRLDRPYRPLPAGEGDRPRCRHGRATVAAPAFTRTNPFTAEVLENFNLNGRGSDKETRHLKLAIEGSGLCFEPGDSLGIYPHNDPQLVDEVIGHMGWNAEEVIPAGKQELPLREALIQHYEITLLSKQLLKQAATFSRDGLQDMVQADANEKLKAYTRGRDLLDLVRDFSIQGIPPREFVPMLRKLPARLYSIASSFRANSGEVDLLIAALALPGPQSRSPGHLLGTLRRAGRDGRLLAGLRAFESELPPAGRCGRADHHGRSRHRRGAVPGLRGGPRGERCRGQVVAVLSNTPNQ